MSATVSAQGRIARLASLTAVHRAFHWLHLHQPQLRQWQLDLVRIPAPPFGERARAAWMLDRFEHLGLSNIHIDEEGNALAELSPAGLPAPPGTSQCILLSAHLDTVFPTGTPLEPTEDKDGSRIYAPGICDNVAGLSGLLAIAAALRYANIEPPIPILFAANVGEEGEGNLRGMRHLFERGLYRGRIAAAIVLEGSGTAVVTRALGSLRLRITVTGPGGHSWTDAGAPNPILILSHILLEIAALALPADPLITINVGMISGGTSINSIPESSTALVDLRSTDTAQLASTAAALQDVCCHFLSTFTTQMTTGCPPKHHVETIGDRPAATLADDSSILHTLRAVDRHFALRTDLRIGSTDANIPIYIGLPAIALGTGGIGGGIHTFGEWYDPTGRETALRRILLILMDMAHILSKPNYLEPPSYSTG